MTRLASVLLVLLLASPAYAQSTVQVIDNRYDQSEYSAMRTVFEVSVRYASSEGLTNLGRCSSSSTRSPTCCAPN